MPYVIVWTEQGRSELRSLNPTTKQAVRRSLRDIDALWDRDVKLLRGHGERYSLRVGGHRVILVRIGATDRFTIEKIGPRPTVYDDYPLRPESD